MREALGRHIAQDQKGLTMERVAGQGEQFDDLVEDGIGCRESGWIFEVAAKDVLDGKGAWCVWSGGKGVLVGLLAQRQQSEACGHLGDLGFLDVKEASGGFGDLGCMELLKESKHACAIVGLFGGDLIAQIGGDLLEGGIFFVLFEQSERRFGEVFVEAEDEVHQMRPNALRER